VLFHSSSEQVREEGLLEESLVEDEACEAQHGNATNSHLKLRQEQEGQHQMQTGQEGQNAMRVTADFQQVNP
jgi:hypothetical protein